jgi:TRAP-type C4-dicarboxylate transport system permease small subunit
MRLAARLFGRLTIQLGTLSGFATLAMMVVVVLDVGGRTFFNTPIAGGNESCELLLVGMIFFGLAAAQKQRQHFAIEIATQHLPAAAQRWVKLFGWLVSFAIVGLLAWVSAKQSWTSMLRGEASYGTISFPIWPARMVIAVGLGLLALQFALDTVRLLGGEDRPGPDSSHS